MLEMVLPHHPTSPSPSGPFLCSCPSPGYLLLSRGSSAPVLLAPPPVTISLPVTTAAISSAVTAAASPGTYRSIASHAAWPHKTRGEPQHLTHWHRSDATPLPPSRWGSGLGRWGRGGCAYMGTGCLLQGGLSPPWPSTQHLGALQNQPGLQEPKIWVKHPL